MATLARDFGVPPVGPAYDFTDDDVEHIGGSLVEIAEKFRQQTAAGRMD
ncbi:MAG: hypothetical protein V3S50_10750 [Acidobacteriota bacterium]